MPPYVRQSSVSLSPLSSRRLPRIAKAFWFVLLAVVARLTVFARRRSGGDFASVDAAAAAEVALVLLSLLLLAQSCRVPVILGKRSRGGALVFVLALGLGILSSIWSPLPAYSGYRAVSVTSQFLAVMVALSYEPDFLCAEWRFLQVACAVLVMQTICLAGVIGFWRGPFQHNNTLTNSAAMVACYCLAEALTPRATSHRKRVLRIVGIGALVIVVVGTSSGSNVAFLVGMLCATLVLRRPRLFALLAVVGIVGSLFLQMEVVQEVVFPGKTLEQIRTMRGRTGLWQVYLERALDHLWFGEGYAASVRIAGGHSTNAHNSLISFLLGTGVVGTLLYLLAFARLILHTASAAVWRVPGAVGVTAGLVAGLTNSMSKGYLGEAYYPETLVFFALFGLAVLHLGQGRVASRWQATWARRMPDPRLAGRTGPGPIPTTNTSSRLPESPAHARSVRP
jgi:O-antigen ligase